MGHTSLGGHCAMCLKGGGGGVVFYHVIWE